MSQARFVFQDTEIDTSLQLVIFQNINLISVPFYGVPMGNSGTPYLLKHFNWYGVPIIPLSP